MTDAPELPDRRERSVPEPPVEPVVVDPRTGDELGPLTDVAYQYFELYERSFRGPLPAPDTLAEYDQVLPGLARRIVERWEAEGQHRQRLERDVVQSRIRIQGRGQTIGAVLSFIAIVGGLALIAAGKDVAGLAAVLTPLAGLAAAFIYGEVQNRRRNGT